MGQEVIIVITNLIIILDGNLKIKMGQEVIIVITNLIIILDGMRGFESHPHHEWSPILPR